MKFSLVAERLLLAAGAVLCTVVALAAADRFIASRVAIQAFAAAELAPTPPTEPFKSVDFALWSQKRINAYKALLSKSFAPPVAVLRIDRVDLQVPVFRGTS